MIACPVCSYVPYHRKGPQFDIWLCRCGRLFYEPALSWRFFQSPARGSDFIEAGGDPSAIHLTIESWTRLALAEEVLRS